MSESSVKGLTMPTKEWSRRDKVLTEVEVDLLVRLSERGWTKARIARELGCSRPTVYWYLKQGGWCPSRGRQRGMLTGLESWLQDRLECHDGNADVVRQELEAIHGCETKVKVTLKRHQN